MAEGSRLPWHLGSIDRQESMNRLASSDNKPGAFLVRTSEKPGSQGELRLDMKDDNNRVRHYKIIQTSNEYHITSSSKRCRNLEDLISHHQKEADGLCQALGMPCLPPRQARQGRTSDPHLHGPHGEYTQIRDTDVNDKEYTPLQNPGFNSSTSLGAIGTEAANTGKKWSSINSPYSSNPPPVATTRPTRVQEKDTLPAHDHTLANEDWYAGEANAEDIATKLNNSNVEGGTFLIRKSRGRTGAYTLCLRAAGQVKHYRIETDNQNQFHISDGMKFPGLRELVKHYKVIPGRLGQKLCEAYRDHVTAAPQLPDRPARAGSSRQKPNTKPRISYESTILNPRPYDSLQGVQHQDEAYEELDPDDDSHFSDSSFDDLPETPGEIVCHTMKELVDTEVEYVKRLKFLITVYDKYKQTITANKVLHQLFEKTADILQLHEKTLLPKLEERQHGWNANPRLGDIMSHVAPYFKIYIEFMTAYEEGMELLGKEAKTTTPISRMLREVKEDEEYHGLQLGDILIAPVQRLPRYKLMLEEYIKHLPSNSGDKEDAQKSLDKVMEAAEFCNKHMATHQNIIKINEMNVRITGFPVMRASSRQFIREEKEMKILDAETGDVNEKTFITFNDYLLVCNVKGAKLQTKYKFNLPHTQILSTDVANTIHLKDTTTKCDVEVFFESENKLQYWKREIEKQIASQQCSKK